MFGFYPLPVSWEKPSKEIEIPKQKEEDEQSKDVAKNSEAPKEPESDLGCLFGEADAPEEEKELPKPIESEEKPEEVVKSLEDA